ncbi:MAG: ComEC/Rec2 family competence protein [Verrucomicrobia bacterium]|nr:ComEC/Rec2 family competence protein [Verrucomicrobiota bacterium]
MAGILGVEAFPAYVGLGGCVVVLALMRARWRQWSALSQLIGWALAGGLSWWLELTPLSPEDLRLEWSGAPRLVEVEGTIRGDPELRQTVGVTRNPWRTVAVVRVRSWREPGGAWAPAWGNILTQTRGTLPVGGFSGASVRIHGLARVPPEAEVPGLFDYRRHLRYRGIHFLLEADSGGDWWIDPSPRTRPWSAWFVPWAQRALAEGLPDSESTRLLWAMTLGWRTALTEDVSRSFVESGTMHVFAISGLHIALLAGVMVAMLRLCRVDRSIAGAVVVPALWFYVAATGWQPSAVRSAVMTTVVVGSWMLRRPGDGLNSLALAAVIILVADPGQLFQPGFQLSFAAVAGLIWGAEGWIRRLDPSRWLPDDPFLPPELQARWREPVRDVLRALGQSLGISLAALVATLPWVIHHFHLFSPVGVLANVVVVPLSGAALAANVGALLTYPLWPGLAGWFNASAWVWMTGMTFFSRWFAGWPGAVWSVASPPWYWWVLYYGVILALGNRWLVLGWNRGCIGGGVAVAILVTGGIWSHSGTEITVLPGGTVVVDGCGWSEDLILNAGPVRSADRVLLPWLRSQGWNRIPRLALIQADAAHVGGAGLLLERWRPDRLVTGSLRQRSPIFRKVVEQARAAGVPVTEVGAGDRIGTWTVVSPRATDRFTTAADNAQVWVGELESVRILVLPDLGPEVRQRLWERWPAELDSVDVVLAEVSEANEVSWQSWRERLQPKFSWVTRVGEHAQRIPVEKTRSWPRLDSEAVGTEVVSIRLREGEIRVDLRDGTRRTWPSDRSGFTRIAGKGGRP